MDTNSIQKLIRNSAELTGESITGFELAFGANSSGRYPDWGWIGRFYDLETDEVAYEGFGRTPEEAMRKLEASMGF